MKTTLIFAAMVSAAAGVAHASPDDIMTVEAGLIEAGFVERVAVQPSELETAEGMQGVQLRVRQAAVRVCGVTPISPAFYNTTTCVRPAERSGYAQLNEMAERRRTGAMASAATIAVRAR